MSAGAGTVRATVVDLGRARCTPQGTECIPRQQTVSDE